MQGALLDLILQPEPFDHWGPWRNQWGYVIDIAHFSDGMIIVHYETPQGNEGTAYFLDWESCERFVLLLEEDRRF